MLPPSVHDRLVGVTGHRNRDVQCHRCVQCHRRTDVAPDVRGIRTRSESYYFVGSLAEEHLSLLRYARARL